MTATLTLTEKPKMYKYTKGSVIKVRRELLRLGCRHDEIEVIQHMNHLKLIYNNQELVVEPFQVLATLKSIRRTVKTIDVWAILCLSKQDKLMKSNQRIKFALFVSLLSLICLLIYIGL